MNLINTIGDAYKDVNRVYVEKSGHTYGYNLMVKLLGDEQPVCIGYSTPDEGILPTVKNLIADHLVRDVKVLDLREHFRPNNKYFGYYGATILRKE